MIHNKAMGYVHVSSPGKLQPYQFKCVRCQTPPPPRRTYENYKTICILPFPSCRIYKSSLPIFIGIAQQPMYILVPNFHLKPGTDPIALDNIISHPLKPLRVLTTVDAATLRKNLPTGKNIHRLRAKHNLRRPPSVSISLWAEFL